MRTYFDVEGFAHILVLKQKHTRTWKWPIGIEAAILLFLFSIYFIFSLTTQKDRTKNK